MPRVHNDKRLVIRNRKIAERYFYWTEIKRRRFDDVLHILEWEEFFISQQTIRKVIREHSDYINTLISNNEKQLKLQL